MTKVLPECIIPSPLQKVEHPLFTEKKVTLLVKRDDLIHPYISGNKYRKLKYNLAYVLDNHLKTVITFGGAFSNHLHATAEACQTLGIRSIGIVRGEELDYTNPTLHFCTEKGMELYFVSRQAYRLKTDSPEIQKILALYPDAFIVPEGGSNALSLPGVREIWNELAVQMSRIPDYIFSSAGTGATLAGLLSGAPESCHVLGFSALRSDHLEKEILKMANSENNQNFTFFSDYHFGGYAKSSLKLTDFIQSFEQKTGIPLDPVYNGKAVFGFMDLLMKNYFPEGSMVVWLHTGGLQGIQGFSFMTNKKALRNNS